MSDDLNAHFEALRQEAENARAEAALLRSIAQRSAKALRKHTAETFETLHQSQQLSLRYAPRSWVALARVYEACNRPSGGVSHSEAGTAPRRRATCRD